MTEETIWQRLPFKLPIKSHLQVQHRLILAETSSINRENRRSLGNEHRLRYRSSKHCCRLRQIDESEETGGGKKDERGISPQSMYRSTLRQMTKEKGRANEYK